MIATEFVGKLGGGNAAAGGDGGDGQVTIIARDH